MHPGVFCALALGLIAAVERPTDASRAEQAAPQSGVATPIYQGRSLDSWLRDLQCMPCGPEYEPAVNAIRAIGAAAIPYLLQRTAQGDGLAAQAIGVLGPVAGTAIPELTALFKKDPVNFAAATTLVSLSAESPVIEAVSNAKAEVRLVAILVLGYGGSRVDAAAVPPLVALLEKGPTEARGDVIWALSMIHKREDLVIPALLRLADDRDAWIRGTAIAALPGFDLTRTSGRVLDALEDPDASVRNDVARAIGQAVERTTNDALVARIVAALIARLRDPSGDVRSQAAWALGAVGRRARSAVSELKRLTNDPNAGVKQAAHASLAHINDTTRD